MAEVLSKSGWTLALCALVAGCGGTVDEEAGIPAALATQQEALSGDCTGIRPPGPGPRVTDNILIGPDRGCFNGTSDTLGHVALGTYDFLAEQATWRVKPADGGADVGAISGEFRTTELFPSISAFQALAAFPGDQAFLDTWNHNGTMIGHLRLDHGAADSSRLFTMAGDYVQGVVFVYSSRSNTGNHFDTLTMQRFHQGGAARHAPVIVSSSSTPPTFLTGGVNFYRNTLVLYDGMMEHLGFGHLAAAWFDPSGTRLTPTFDAGVLEHPDASHSLQLFPLYGGAMALRVDGVWTRVIPTSPGPGSAPPAWLASHPNMTLHFIRNLRGYALVPPSLELTPVCAQRLLLFAQNGNACGSVTFGIDSAECVTGSIDLGKDGSVIQVSPRTTCLGSGPCTCTHYVYPRILQ